MRLPDDPHEPETKHAWLPSLALRRATKHSYAATREIPSTEDGRRMFEHVFTCDETGVERRWGVASAAEHPRSAS